TQGTELDAQKEFNKLLKDSINKHPDIPTSINRYQKAVSDTHTRLDFVIGPGLYIIGSNMVLEIGKIDNYNNNILIAPAGSKPGKNNINDKKTKSPPNMEGSKPKKMIVKTNNDPIILDEPVKSKPKISDFSTNTNSNTNTAKKDLIETPIGTKNEDQHETIKYILYSVIGALIVFMIR
ncbi:hypothetical protein, partial [Bartonella sp. CL50QHWL]|uniref:hypothetical protein n=1 Tax=Bartonella sp. CL50QHWL TaxID=3243536 RepID=UPI0035D06DC5